MSKINKEIAEQIVFYAGGRKNIINNTTCMTRLHLRYRKRNKIDLDAIKNIEGTYGVVDGETIQIVFGPGKVRNVGSEISALTKIPLGSEIDFNAEAIVENKQTIAGFFKHFANIFLPILPGIAGAGLINGITRSINVTTNNALIGEWWYALIMSMGWILFMYLPIFVGMNTVKEFKGTPILGGIGGALAVLNSEMPLLRIIDNQQITLPILNTSYDNAMGGLIAAVLTGIAFAYLERLVRRFVPEVVDIFLTPLITIIIGGFLSVLIFQYLGFVLTNIIFVVTEFVFVYLGIIGGFILAMVQLPLVSLGLHRVFVPLHAILSDPLNKTEGINYLLPILMVAGGGQVGAALALYFKTDNIKLKQAIIGTIPAGILGVGEPLMYAVTLPLFRPFITACIGSGFGGLTIALLKVGAISQGVSGVMAPLIINGGSRFHYLLGLLMAYIGGFIITYLFGYRDIEVENIFGEKEGI